MRGFLLGILWGTIVITAVAAVISLLSPLPSGPDVNSNTPGNVNPSAASDADSGIERVVVDADLVNAVPTVPGNTTSTDNLASMDGTNTDSGARPVVGGESTLGNPDDGDNSRAETGSATQPPAAGTTPKAPEQGQPASNDLGSVAQTSVGQPNVGSDTANLNDPTNNDTDTGVLVNNDTPVAPSVPGTAPSTPEDETELALSSEPAQPVVPTVSDSGSGFGADATEAENADTSEGTTSTAEPARIAALPQAGSDDETTVSSSIGTAVLPLTDRDSTPSETIAAGTQEPPIVLYQEPFENPENKPIMSIILIDDDQSIGIEALANFPQPLTMAVDPSAPDAAEKMARHRAAGFEVVSLIDLPKGATAQDAEVFLAASFAAMPEVVAVLEGPNSGVQGNRSLADQVSAIVAGTGHGLILQDNGLNTVYKLAEREGIPAGLVFRDFDGAGQSGLIMRRFLDQAAFRAGRDGAVIMLGRVRPDTVSTLLLWALQDRTLRVALAPVSAVLNRTEGQ